MLLWTSPKLFEVTAVIKLIIISDAIKLVPIICAYEMNDDEFLHFLYFQYLARHSHWFLQQHWMDYQLL